MAVGQPPVRNGDAVSPQDTTRPDFPSGLTTEAHCCPDLPRKGLMVAGPPTERQRMSVPPARRDYKPSTTTMLMLEDLERMSSSAVYSGESNHVRICWRLSN